MSKTTVAKHIHQYQQVALKTSKRSVFRCMLPDCSHYLPEPEFAIGRSTICNMCPLVFLLQREHLDIKKPVCPACKELRIRRKEALQAIGREGDLVEDD